MVVAIEGDPDDLDVGIGGVPLANLSHIGIAVENAEQTAELLSATWAIGLPEVLD